jgi:hypothetical protein
MPYTRPIDWVPIPEFDMTKDEIYLLLSGKSLHNITLLMLI